MSVRRIYAEKRQGFFDIPARWLCADLTETFRLTDLKAVRIFVRYDVEGLSDDEYSEVLPVVFYEPPVDTLYEEKLPEFKNSRSFCVEYLPGQFDNRADAAEECCALITQKERPTVRCATVYVLVGKVDDVTFAKIKEYLINPVECREATAEKPKSLAMKIDPPAPTETIDALLTADEKALAALHEAKGFAMSQADLAFCQKYFRDTEHRAPTETELRVIDTYWSDHCRHTTFGTAIDMTDIDPGYCNDVLNKAYELYLADREKIYGGQPKDVTLMDLATIAMKVMRKEGLLKDLDESEEINACSIHVTANVNGQMQDWLVMFKNETHNHPTEIEPFGGAATCLGGAIRDPLSGRSYVYQAMRITGAADPRRPIGDTLKGKLPQKKITLGAAAGYSSYGNQVGLATGQVKEIYHEGYMAKRMEIGAVIGAAPAENVVREKPRPGDVIILVGGRTGRDGCGGATGSSKEHTTESLSTCGAEVQKGNPPTERKIQRLFRNPDAAKIIKRCNDFGAGGVAVAIGELAEGLMITLDEVKKKYEGLSGTELAISESQERMAVVVAPQNVAAFEAFAAAENLETAQVAVVTEEPRIVMLHGGKKIVDIARKFLDTNGVQQHTLAQITAPDEKTRYLRQIPAAVAACGVDLEKAWLANLRDLNVCSQKGLSERFDSTIGAGSVLMPFGGKKQLTPAEGMAAKLPVENGSTTKATVMTYGFDPHLAEWSPFHGAVYAIVAAAAKIAAMGADAGKIRLTLQEYFEHLGSDAKKWGKPFAALLGALLAQHELKIPAIGGKDSMSGTFMDMNVPPTLVAFAVAVADAPIILSPEFKYAGNKIYALNCPKNNFDMPDFATLRKNFAAVSRLAKEKKIFAAKSVGKGGIAAAVSEMALGNFIGFMFASGSVPREKLFLPDYGTILIEVSPKFVAEEELAGLNAVHLGTTTENGTIVFGKAATLLVDIEEAYTAPLNKIFPVKTVAKDQERPRINPYKHGNRMVPHTPLASVPVLIPVFPGTNCEYDSAKAWLRVGANPKILVVRDRTPDEIKETIDAIEKELRTVRILMFPGGFSGGDEPGGSGKFIAAMFRNPKLKNAVTNLINHRDGLILGICNGFQALIKLGLLPYGEIRDLTENSPTLTYNAIGRHVSTMVQTKVVSNLSPWYNNVSVGALHTVAVSHGEGRFVAEREIVAKMRMQGQIATQYVDAGGWATMESPYNPNGSTFAVEGITSPDGRILGKMGHSERIGTFIAKNVPGEKDEQIFAAAVRYYS